MGFRKRANAKSFPRHHDPNIFGRDHQGGRNRCINQGQGHTLTRALAKQESLFALMKSQRLWVTSSLMILPSDLHCEAEL